MHHCKISSEGCFHCVPAFRLTLESCTGPLSLSFSLSLLICFFSLLLCLDFFTLCALSFLSFLLFLSLLFLRLWRAPELLLLSSSLLSMSMHLMDSSQRCNSTVLPLR